MTWVLTNGSKRFPIAKSRAFGRDDVPGESALSRAHFEIVVKRGRAYARDLRSTNGTQVDGKRLGPDVPALIGKGSLIRVGRTEFKVEREGARETRPTYFGDALAFATLAWFLLSRNDNAFGRALGPTGFLVIVGLLLVSVLTSAGLWGLVLQVRSMKRYAQYVLAVTVTAALLHTGLMTAAERQWQISEQWMTAKIEYFCLEKFEPMACSRQVHACPTCATEIDRYKRDRMVANLAAFRARTPARR